MQTLALSGSNALIIGALLSALAGFSHLICIAIGAPAYRFVGAGEKMAQMAQAGKMEPTLVTLAISGVLFTWAGYALSGAGVIGRLPLLKLALSAICAVYLFRAVAFPLLKKSFPGNSQTFWLVSSGICLLLGILHLYGLVTRWSAL